MNDQDFKEKVLQDLTEIKTQMGERCHVHTTAIAELRKSVTNLESWRWYVVGASTVIATVLPLVLRYLKT